MEDKILRTLVEDRLACEPSVDAANIGVSVHKGIVHLSGHVAGHAQKIAIEVAVKHVPGVRGYVEDLQIGPYGDPRSDDAIAARIADLLDRCASLPRDTVKVKVDKGVVILSGDVEWASQRLAAEEASASCPACASSST